MKKIQMKSDELLHDTVPCVESMLIFDPKKRL